MSAVRKGVFSSDEEEEEESEKEREEGVRRSKRITKGKRFQFWKNERSVYVEVSMVWPFTYLPR
jgi:hypothetical protein